MDVKIYKNGILEQELSLSEGSYLLGRSNNCDIVLAEKNISRKHARLVVANDQSSIEDLGSSNGVLVGGSRINKQKFVENLTVNIGCFTLLFQPVLNKKDEKLKTTSLGRIISLAGCKPYKTAYLLLGLFYLLIAYAVVSFAGSTLDTLFQKMELERAILISKSLVQLNSPYWIQSDVTMFRIDAFEKEDGVIQVLLVDKYGRILAPIDKVDHTIDHPLYAKSLKSGVIEIEKQGKDDYYISHPVRLGTKIYGAAVVTYRVRPLASVAATNFGVLYGVLGFFLLLIFCIAWALVRIIIQPLKDLSIEIGDAIRERRDSLTASTAYPELNDIKNLFERLFARLAFVQDSVIPDNGVNGMQTHVKTGHEVQPGQGVLFNEVLELLSKQKKNACCVDLDTHQLVGFTPKFLSLFEVVDTEMCHMLEVFQEEEILLTIMSVLDGNERVGNISISGRSIAVKLYDDRGGNGNVILVFDEEV